MDETPRPGRAFAVYSLLRLALLAACVVVLRLVLGDGANELLVIGGAVLLSALLSLVLLRRQREAFTAASVAAADRRRALREARRARLADPQEPNGG
jgi:LPXTG-motif cell wall-anchored protein